ncbi:MAG: hypothetical protein PHE29_13720 [Tissierellia bacterium]|nr:hypothetical protein [Tissierellia bacterium]
MKRNYLYIIIAVLFLFNIYTINKIGNIERTMDKNMQYIYSEQDNTRREINNIYSNVDEKLKKQASILDSYDVTFGDQLNTENLTVPVTISVTPKEITDNIIVDLLINDERHTMLKNGTTFIASINAYLFDPFKLMVVLNDKGKEKLETIDEYDNLQHKYILDLYANFLGSTKFGSGKYQYDGDIVINFVGISNNSPEKISISRYVNGKIMDEKEVYMRGNESIMYSVKEEVELSANDRIELYINVEDKYGLNYKYIVLADKIDSEGKLVKMRPEWTNGSMVEIKDKNGKVLFEWL